MIRDVLVAEKLSEDANEMKASQTTNGAYRVMTLMAEWCCMQVLTDLQE
jgi:hypothetical protein